MSRIQRIYNLSSVADAQSTYDDWAQSYEKDMFDESQDYVAPAIACGYVLKCLGGPRIDSNVEILDAGCGTGLVGSYLNKVGARNLDGVDLSTGMLDVARKANIYRSLGVADLSRPLSQRDGSYDLVVCIGTLTQCHVGPQALDEFVRVTKKGGWIVATILESIWQKNGYEARVQSLIKENKVLVVSSELEDYRRGAGVRAIMLVLQVRPK